MDLEEIRWIEVPGRGALIPGQAVELYGNTLVRLHMQRAVLWNDEFVTTTENDPAPTFEDYAGAVSDMQDSDPARAAGGHENLSFLESLQVGNIGGHFVLGPSAGFFPLVNFEGLLPEDHAWQTFWARRELTVRAFAESAAAVRTDVITPPRQFEILQEDPVGNVSRMNLRTGRVSTFRHLDAPVIFAPGMAAGAVKYETAAALSLKMRASMADRGKVFVALPPAVGVDVHQLPVALMADTATQHDHLVWSWYKLPAWAAQRPPEELWSLTEPHWQMMAKLVR